MYTIERFMIYYDEKRRSYEDGGMYAITDIVGLYGYYLMPKLIYYSNYYYFGLTPKNSIIGQKYYQDIPDKTNFELSI